MGATALPAQPRMQILRKHGLSHRSAPPWGSPGEKKGKKAPRMGRWQTPSRDFWYQSLTSTHWCGYPQGDGQPLILVPTRKHRRQSGWPHSPSLLGTDLYNYFRFFLYFLACRLYS